MKSQIGVIKDQIDQLAQQVYQELVMHLVMASD